MTKPKTPSREALPVAGKTEIDRLRAENERLREALKNAVELLKQNEHIAFYKGETYCRGHCEVDCCPALKARKALGKDGES